jgi:BirA family transcriptional regulator, biotin operon repressor / biotin---[acetyl-CoA-carboxylase] ligase
LTRSIIFSCYKFYPLVAPIPFYNVQYECLISYLLKNSNLLSHPISRPIGHPFIILPSVDSTNNYAMGQVQAGTAGHGTTWFAHEQTAGKGQRGKHWLTRPHENIILSMAIQPAWVPPQNPFLLSAVIALGCYDFYKNYAGEETRIKWPNDLYWRDRKAGGILIENSFRGTSWLYAIAGVGINVNQTTFDTGILNPVSLRQITGKSYDVVELARELCRCVDHRYQSLAGADSLPILQQYLEALYKLNTTVKLKKGNTVFETTIRGVSPFGRLLTSDTMERAFDFGEVEWVI